MLYEYTGALFFVAGIVVFAILNALCKCQTQSACSKRQNIESRSSNFTLPEKSEQRDAANESYENSGRPGGF